MQSRWPAFKRGLNIALVGMLAIVLIAVVAVTVLPRVFGWRFLTVLSPSMSPTLSVGAIVAVQPVDPAIVKVGDVVVYRAPGGTGVLITHRVVEVVADGATRRGFRTRGDANNVADSYVVAPQSLAGIVRFNVPLAGYMLAFVRTPLGLLTTLILPGLALMFLEFLNLVRGVRRSQVQEPVKPV